MEVNIQELIKEKEKEGYNIIKSLLEYEKYCITSTSTVVFGSPDEIKKHIGLVKEILRVYPIFKEEYEYLTL